MESLFFYLLNTNSPLLQLGWNYGIIYMGTNQIFLGMFWYHVSNCNKSPEVGVARIKFGNPITRWNSVPKSYSWLSRCLSFLRLKYIIGKRKVSILSKRQLEGNFHVNRWRVRFRDIFLEIFFSTSSSTVWVR